jgi:hypothetical protein
MKNLRKKPILLALPYLLMPLIELYARLHEAGSSVVIIAMFSNVSRVFRR